MILPCLFTAKTDEKGWGVFTSENIVANTIIEISPVIIMTANEKLLLDKTTLYNYIFDWENNLCCMAMGYLPIYNHDYNSNSEYFQDYIDGTIFIKTKKYISMNQEVTINYNGDFDCKKKVWFDVK